MIAGREKFLFTGPTGAGKTKGMFDVAIKALAVGKRVFYLAFDDGYWRHLKDVEKYLVHHTDPEVTPKETAETFHLWDCNDWPMTRRAYNESKVLWEKGDWLMFDRADMAWDFIQEYTGSLIEGVSTEELDELYYARRMAKLSDSTPSERERIKSNPSGEQEVDWSAIKGSFKGVLYDACCGPDAKRLRINVIVSEMSQMGIRRFSKSETTEQKADQRRLYGYNMTIQGEKNIPGWLETTVVFLKENGVYTIGTDKDRERKAFASERLDEGLGFWETYQSLIGEELAV